VTTVPIVATRVYEPRGASRTLLSCRADEVVLSGPAGTGKTMGALHKVHIAMMKHPGSRALLVRKTLVSLGATTLNTWRKHVIVDSIRTREVTYYGGSQEEPAQYRYHRNGSAVVIGGMDKPTKIMSSEYDLILVDEATEFFVQDWEACLSRLRNGMMPYSQLIGCCNPDAEHHWMKQRANDGVITLLESRHEDNPAYFDRNGQMTDAGRAYLAKLDKLTGVRYWRLRKGLWVAAEGVVYEHWDPKVHLIDKMPDGWETWPRWWSIDFGYRNPFVLQCWAEDGDGRLYLYREIYMTGRIVEDHVRKIMKIVKYGDGSWREPQPTAVICDHDAEDRATFERHAGLSTVAAHKEIKPGIDAVTARLRVDETGRPAIFILRDALVERDESLKELGLPTCTAEEIASYVWAKTPDGKVLKEVPEDKDNHGMDAKRYIVAERDIKGQPRMRVLRMRRKS
jgi:PBSX family phage terminase large subunit